MKKASLKMFATGDKVLVSKRAVTSKFQRVSAIEENIMGLIQFLLSMLFKYLYKFEVFTVCGIYACFLMSYFERPSYLVSQQSAGRRILELLVNLHVWEKKQ